MKPTVQIIPKLEVSEYRDSFEVWPDAGAFQQRVAIIPFDGDKARARETADMFVRLYALAQLVRDFTTEDSAGHMRYLNEQAKIALNYCCDSMYAARRMRHCCQHSYLLPCPRCEVS